MSHTSVDKGWVRKLGERLESETFAVGDPRKIRVFFDEWDIDYNENIVNRLNDGLQQATFLAAVLTPEFLDSGWTNLEWTHWVANDPRAANLIGVLLRDASLGGDRRISLPMPFLAKKYFDFRNPGDFEPMFVALLNRIRGVRPSRGNQHSPRYSLPGFVAPKDEEFSWEVDEHHEILFGNMLRVVSLPRKISSAPTKSEKPSDVWAILTEGQIPPFIIREGRLWTFSLLEDSDNLLRNCVATGGVRTTPTSEWLADDDKSRWVTALLNQTLRSKLGSMGVKREENGRFYFKANKDGSKRMFNPRGDRERQVAAKCLSKDGESSFFVHASARIKFERLGDEYYISIDPGYLFTQDGLKPLTRLATLRLTVQWSGAQRNDAIFRDLIFWMKVLSNGEKEFNLETEGEPVVVCGLPESTRMEKGLPFDQIRIGSLLNIGAPDLQEIADNAAIAPSEQQEGNDEDA